MKTKQIVQLNATTVEKLFIIGIILLGALLILNYTFVSNILKAQASDVDHKRIDLRITEESVKQTETMKDFLASHQELIHRIDRASGKPTDNKSPQDQALDDLQDYADILGLSITGYDIQSADSTANSSATPPATSTPPTASPTPDPSATSQSAVKGVNSIDVVVTFSQPVNYSQLLALLSLLEYSASRMELKDINVTSPTQSTSSENESDTTNTAASSTSLTFKVYTR